MKMLMHRSQARTGSRAALSLAVALMALLMWQTAPAPAAQSPFGVGLPEQNSTGLVPWIASLQKEFYRDLTAALKALRESGQAFWWLAGLSFAYGVVHAAGPGHGKIVISSYLMANEESMRRGVVIAFLAAMVQAAMAITIVGVAAIALNMTSMAMTQTARFFEIGSYALIAALGLFLLARKAGGLIGGRTGHGHDHGHGDHCGHAHAPSPDEAMKARGLKGAALAILSVGIRPCSGALIVLVFALAQGLFWAGVASAVLMGLGTALTIAVLAVTAVYAKDLASRFAGVGSNRAAFVMTGLEISGALVISAFGLLLLAGALSG